MIRCYQMCGAAAKKINYPHYQNNLCVNLCRRKLIYAPHFHTGMEIVYMRKDTRPHSSMIGHITSAPMICWSSSRIRSTATAMPSRPSLPCSCTSASPTTSIPCASRSHAASCTPPIKPSPPSRTASGLRQPAPSTAPFSASAACRPASTASRNSGRKISVCPTILLICLAGRR